jgi:hypothetical protein
LRLVEEEGGIVVVNQTNLLLEEEGVAAGQPNVLMGFHRCSHVVVEELVVVGQTHSERVGMVQLFS